MAIGLHPLLQPHTLYLVLLELPQVDLLRAQRVCKDWRDTIRSSGTLQQALFFRPDYSEARAGDIEVNGLLLQHFEGFFQENSDDHVCGPFQATGWHAQAALDRPDPDVLRAYARPEASWRKMLLCRPAPKRLQVVKQAHGMMGTQGVYGSVSLTDNGQTAAFAPPHATFGLIYDIMQTHMFPSSLTRVGVTATMGIYGGPRPPRLHRGTSDVTSSLLPDSALQTYRRALAASDFAGPGSVLIRLVTVHQCCIDEEVTYYHADYLKSEGATVDIVNDVGWDVKKTFRW